MAFKLIGIAAALVLSSGTSFAETLNCRIATYSPAGWSRVTYAREFMPPRTTHVIRGDTAYMQPWKVRGPVTRSANRVVLKYTIEFQNSTTRIVTYTFVPKSRNLSVRVSGRAGYERLGPAHGTCSVTR